VPDSRTIWGDSTSNSLSAHVEGSRFRFEVGRDTARFRDLCDVAIRRNPRRPFLFVSRVLGRHWPTRPHELRSAAAQLGCLVEERSMGRPTMFIGMAETATALAQAVFAHCHAAGIDCCYTESTRRESAADVAFRFSEAHSHARSHRVNLPRPHSRVERALREAPLVVVIDDEATTGNTALACRSAIERWRGTRCDFLLAVLMSWLPRGAELSGRPEVLSISEGTFSFESDGRSEGDTPKGTAAPPRDSRTPDASSPLPATESSLGLESPQQAGKEPVPAAWTRGTALVVGSGEFAYRPLLLAERLEAEGATAWLQATTRSPIRVGGAITHARSFPALDGEPRIEYLYNIPDEHRYDRVILCVEGRPPEAGHPIWSVPRLEVHADGMARH
jgi:Phosphoribosyl transferase/TRSP domain C terminus to PRTase_2